MTQTLPDLVGRMVPQKRGKEVRDLGLVALGWPETRQEAFWVWEGRNPYLRGISHKSLIDLDPGNSFSLCEFGKEYYPPFIGSE